MTQEFTEQLAKRMNKYIEAIEKIKNEYDGFYFENKYEQNTHEREFKILEELKGEKVAAALDWIRTQYDCYYKNELEEGNPFDYLTGLAEKESA